MARDFLVTRKMGHGCHRRRVEHKDYTWCWDREFDHTTGGNTHKRLPIVDEYMRECLTLKVD